LKLSERNYKRLVVKIGSSLFYSDKKKLDFALLNNIVSEVSELAKRSNTRPYEIIIVSSGAIALGMSLLGQTKRPKELSHLQAIAAIGQNELMNNFRQLFIDNQLHCAQILLTWDDFDNRKRYLNAKNTLNTLLKLKSIPVINENDTVSTEEIRFGDNDRLSALVASLVNADMLIMLSDVDGLLGKNRQSLISVVDNISPQIRALASPSDKSTSVGGMVTKLDAAKIAVDSGIPCIIASGRKKNIISLCINEPETAGTLFLPKTGCLAEKKRWIAFGTKPKGSILVDEGAQKALKNKKSLLSVGITGSSGDFDTGDIVSICDCENKEFARGKICISQKNLESIKGKKSDKEVIHCDNIVIL